MAIHDFKCDSCGKELNDLEPESDQVVCECGSIMRISFNSMPGVNPGCLNKENIPSQ